MNNYRLLISFIAVRLFLQGDQDTLFIWGRMINETGCCVYADI